MEHLHKKNCVFFEARSPSKLVYIGAKGAFGKILGSVGQKWISEKVSMGDPLGRQVVESPKKGASTPLPPPLNPPLAIREQYYFQDYSVTVLYIIIFKTIYYFQDYSVTILFFAHPGRNIFFLGYLANQLSDMPPSGPS